MGDQFLNTLRLFINQNPLSKTDPLKEHISNGRYDLDVLYYRGVGIMAGTIGERKVVISYNRFENPEVFAMVIDGKQVDGHVSIDVVDTFCKTGELLAGVTLVPTLTELIKIARDTGGVDDVMLDHHEYVVIISADHCINQNATVLYVNELDKANSVAEIFIKENYQAEVLPLKMNTTQFILKCIVG